MRGRATALIEQTADSRSDLELLTASEDGDRLSFGLLFDRHSRAVFATAFAVVRDRSDAEELLSDAFVLLWRKRSTVEFYGDSLLPWLITTVRFLASNNRRHSTRTSTVPLDDDIDGGQSTSPESALEIRMLSRQLDALIAALDPLDRRIVQACLVDDLSYEQAALRFGISHGAVRNRLSRTKKKLRNRLDPEGNEE